MRTPWATIARRSRLAHFKRNVGRVRMWQTFLVTGVVGLLAVLYALARLSALPVGAFVAGAAIPYALRTWLTARLRLTMWALKFGGLVIFGASLISLFAPNVVSIPRVLWLHGTLVAVPLYLSTYFFVLSDPDVTLVE